METERNDQDAKGANDQNQNQEQKARQDLKSKSIGIKNEDQNIIGGTSGNSPTNEQPSASQNNQWQQDHGSGSMPKTGEQNSDQYENNSRPAREFSASEDDELEAEMPKDYRTDEFIEENNLESTDQDYRDGENPSGEDQDDRDELRIGK